MVAYHGFGMHIRALRGRDSLDFRMRIRCAENGKQHEKHRAMLRALPNRRERSRQKSHIDHSFDEFDEWAF
ncbi:hypothetical protein [Burkholderia thailandensis]|uniref:Uncharacterized protein n=1 Tax=Burkholderia thailandensis TaxID=57975 RepID=A0AAW9CYI5_BURTH|nr:hypothetical protein [Burkholderia thailandensis]MCS3391220.1 hypothetical protein [Burkholderia thailandensis]MCS6424072.1 hypothetical protein [Burkholderia thailandensis]MCS6452206.1 hypothetical protein [Burkholderia thailandensis]MCS6463630.1 hypothetical protein [Burkholderia thailandensis]MCS6481159.1 hypothetical protein [Burkholderia thailandensis]